MKKLFLIVAALLLTISLCSCQQKEKYPSPTEKFFVNDFANIIDDSDETEFYTKAAALDKSTTAQVVLVTIEDLQGDTPENYALELGRLWGIGEEKTDNGVLVLLSREDREIYIAVGYGLEGALPDSKTGRIIDVYGLNYLREDNFSKGITAIGNALINEIYMEYGLEPENGYVGIENVTVKEDVNGGSVVGSWVIMIIILIIISFITRRFGGGWIFFAPRTRHFGGFSGNNNGGFGGFSGGGGSFGGGGSGRSF